MLLDSDEISVCCVVDSEEAVERQYGWQAFTLGSGLRRISSSKLQSHAALWEEQRPRAAGASAVKCYLDARDDTVVIWHFN